MDTSHDYFEVFPWNENFETGIAVIDQQHRELVNLLNQLSDTLVNDDAPELERTFDNLAAYAQHHFETEESYWKGYFGDDEWLTSHQEKHADFLPYVNELKREQGSKPLRDIVEDIIKFLIRWLAFHIIDNDKRMAVVVSNLEAGHTLQEAKEISENQMEGATKILIDTVLKMYDDLSSRTLELMRERVERKKVEAQLRVANRDLERLAITDQLTGLFNRRYFDEVFAHELGRARRENRYLTLIMLDVDHFKRLNDHYGHLKGDDALRRISKNLQKLCRRPGDYAFRLGGEEFGLLVTDQTSEHGREFAEKIRTSIESLGIPNIASDVAKFLTVSVGVVSKIPYPADTTDSFIGLADRRLYSAKALGRNRVVSK